VLFLDPIRKEGRWGEGLPFVEGDWFLGL